MANSTKISEYSTTAANNTSIDSIDIDENCAASGINNALRSVLKHQADAFTQGTPIALDQTNNRVGIGTTSPATPLDTVSNTNGVAMRVRARSADEFGLIEFVENDGSTAHAYVGTPAADTLAFYSNGLNERMRIDSSGNVGIGTTSIGLNNELSTTIETSGVNNSRITVNHSTGGSSNGSYFMQFGYGGSRIGSITQNSTTSVAFNTSSDHRLKENVADMTGAIDRVKQLAPKRFNFIADADTTVDGFLAHEAQAVVPEAVTGTHNEVDDDGNAVMQGIDQSKLVPLLTGALQEAITKIETLETEMTALKTRVTALEA